MVVQQLDGGVAEAALRHIDDALEGEIVGHGGLATRQIGQRIADPSALVEPVQAADLPAR